MLAGPCPPTQSNAHPDPTVDLLRGIAAEPLFDGMAFLGHFSLAYRRTVLCGRAAFTVDDDRAMAVTAVGDGDAANQPVFQAPAVVGCAIGLIGCIEGAELPLPHMQDFLRFVIVLCITYLIVPVDADRAAKALAASGGTGDARSPGRRLGNRRTADRAVRPPVGVVFRGEKVKPGHTNIIRTYVLDVKGGRPVVPLCRYAASPPVLGAIKWRSVLCVMVVFTPR